MKHRVLSWVSGRNEGTLILKEDLSGIRYLQATLAAPTQGSHSLKQKPGGCGSYSRKPFQVANGRASNRCSWNFSPLTIVISWCFFRNCRSCAEWTLRGNEPPVGGRLKDRGKTTASEAGRPDQRSCGQCLRDRRPSEQGLCDPEQRRPQRKRQQGDHFSRHGPRRGRHVLGWGGASAVRIGRRSCGLRAPQSPRNGASRLLAETLPACKLRTPCLGTGAREYVSISERYGEGRRTVMACGTTAQWRPGSYPSLSTHWMERAPCVARQSRSSCLFTAPKRETWPSSSWRLAACTWEEALPRLRNPRQADHRRARRYQVQCPVATAPIAKRKAAKISMVRRPKRSARLPLAKIKAPLR